MVSLVLLNCDCAYCQNSSAGLLKNYHYEYSDKHERSQTHAHIYM